jgi:subtilisin family serine protease
MVIKPTILLLSALFGLSTYSMTTLANDLLDDTTSQVTDSTETITAKSDLIIVTFHDASYIEMLTAYHASQTKGDYISAEQYAQAQTLLDTLSSSYGAELTIARIARLGAVVLKLSDMVELDELNNRLDSTLNTLSIINYAEPDPYLSVNALQSLQDDANRLASEYNLTLINRTSRVTNWTMTETIIPYGTTVEPGQEGVAQPQFESWGYQRVQADQLSDAAADNLTVCIIDSGYDTSHEDLPHDRVTGTDTEVLGAWDNDEQGHGTHIAGIIAALDNQYGSKGVLPNGKVNLHIKRVLDENNALAELSGYSVMSYLADNVYDCAEEGANIISLSVTGISSIIPQYASDVFQAVYDNNVLVVAANGNHGLAAPTETKAYPASFSSVIGTGSININNEISGFSNQLAETELVAPGGGIYSTMPIGKEYYTNISTELRINGEAYTHLIALANESTSINITAKFTVCGLGYCLPSFEDVEDSICLSINTNGYCTYEFELDPDTGLNKIKRDDNGNISPLSAAEIVVLRDFDSDDVGNLTDPTLPLAYSDQLKALEGETVTLEININKGADGYSLSNGTSMATPYVAGAAALAWSNNLECTAAEVRTALNESAKDLGDDGWDAAYGHGLVQAKDASDYMRSHCAAYIDAEPVTYKNLTFKADNDKYVVSEKADGYLLGDVRAVRTNLNNWDRLKMVDLNGGLLVSGDEVNFLNAYGNYISRSDTEIYARSSDVADAETFTIETSTTDAQTIGNGSSISIKASNGLYWQTESNGYLNADANVVEGTERSCLDSECQSSVFELVVLPQVTYFKTTKGKRVETLNTLENDIQANNGLLGSLKEFSIIDLNEGGLMSGDKVRLQSHYLGTYVARDGTDLHASSSDVEDSETFIIENIAKDYKELVTGDLITIKASNDLYWQSKLSGEVDADGSSVEGSEKSCTTSEEDCGWTVFELEIKEL